MNNVTDLLKHRLRKMQAEGTASFLVCPVCNANKWGVVCFSNGDAPFISNIVCISEICAADTAYEVTNGLVSVEAMKDE